MAYFVFGSTYTTDTTVSDHISIGSTGSFSTILQYHGGSSAPSGVTVSYYQIITPNMDPNPMLTVTIGPWHTGNNFPPGIYWAYVTITAQDLVLGSAYSVNKVKINGSNAQVNNTLDIYVEARTSVILNANGGEFPTGDTTTLWYTQVNYIYNNSLNTPQIPTRSGYVFKGFYTTTQGCKNGGEQTFKQNGVYSQGSYWDSSGAWINSTTSATPITFYALWVPDNTKIATEEEVNMITGGSINSAKQCPPLSRINTMGGTVTTTYSNTQLVQLRHIIKS